MSSSIDMTTKHFDMFLNGEIVSSSDGGYFESVNPSNGDVFATITNATLEDVEAIVRAAKESADKGIWRNFTMAERGVYLKNVAQAIREHAKELAELESMDVGKTLKHSTFIDVPTCADTFEYFSNLTNQLDERKNQINLPVDSSTIFEPIGVVLSITPWNYPLIMAAWKLGPALMTGNSVILKPSPLACASVMRLAQLIQESGIPKGVVNIVSTSDVEVSKALVRHEDVNMVSFTGGTETGREIMRIASEVPKKVTLELGGKSANIVFADCDIEAALGGTMSAIFINQGQMCTAGSRLLIDENIYEEFMNELTQRTKALKIGNALDYQNQFGPVISKEHCEKLLTFVNRALEEGATLECGGKILTGDEFGKGFYFEPTILSNVDPKSSTAQEEAFGPILSVIKFSSLDEAVKIANDSKYGLSASVWTKDKSKPGILSKELQVGTVWINTYGGFYNEVGFGGCKQSGFGRELGIEGLLEYCHSKHICIDQTPGGKSLVTSWY